MEKCLYCNPDNYCLKDGMECIVNGFECKAITCNRYTPSNKTKILDGVGKDAEIVTNEKGGKQSKSPMAMHLVDPDYLTYTFSDLAERYEYLDEGNSTVVDDEDKEVYGKYKAIYYIALFMKEDLKNTLTEAMDALCEDELQQTARIAKVLQYGVGRYEANNWRLIPQEEHINHALIHILADLMGDKQDDHIDHALCRLMMARATQKSDNFSYTEYVKQ